MMDISIIDAPTPNKRKGDPHYEETRRKTSHQARSKRRAELLEANGGIPASRRKKANNTTGYVGVTPYYGKFRARITVDGKRLHFGAYATAEEAAVARDNAAREHLGETTVYNFPRDDERGA